MDSTVLEFLRNHRIGVLATTVSKDRIHASSIHYSHVTNPSLRLIIQTDSRTRKAKDIVEGESTKAAFVTGFSEEEWKTLQMEGIVRRIMAKDVLDEAIQIHHEKFPGVMEHVNDTTVFLEFIPLWWRFTDFTTVPITVFTNE